MDDDVRIVNLQAGDELRLTAGSPMAVTYKATGPADYSIHSAVAVRDAEIKQLRADAASTEQTIEEGVRASADEIIDRLAERLRAL